LKGKKSFIPTWFVCKKGKNLTTVEKKEEKTNQKMKGEKDDRQAES
jgi:hypothetical protein